MPSTATRWFRVGYDRVTLRRGYIDGLLGQVHFIEAPADEAAPLRPPLVCLHATAYSSESLRPLIAAFDGDRRVIALDTPGYGGSVGPDGAIGMAVYADALAHSVARLSPDQPVDIFAYHTGVSIAVEAAVRHPGLIGRIVAIGIPLFVGPDRASWKERLVVPHQLGEGLEQFAERWDYLVTQRPEGMSLQRGFGNFIDELRAWPNGARAHSALFEHDLAARLAMLESPLFVINPTSTLSGVSRAAAAYAGQATVLERPDLSGAIFERHAEEIAALIRGFLDDATDDKTGHDAERRRAEIAEAGLAGPDHPDAAPRADRVGSGARDGASAHHR